MRLVVSQPPPQGRAGAVARTRELQEPSDPSAPAGTGQSGHAGTVQPPASAGHCAARRTSFGVTDDCRHMSLPDKVKVLVLYSLLGSPQRGDLSCRTCLCVRQPSGTQSQVLASHSVSMQCCSERLCLEPSEQQLWSLLLNRVLFHSLSITAYFT